MNITELKELAEKATPGTWAAKKTSGAGLSVHADISKALGPRYSHDCPIYHFGSDSCTMTIAYELWTQFPRAEWEAMQEANANYIAAANPAEILELIAKLEDAKGEIRALRATEAGLRGRLAAVEADMAQRVPVGWLNALEEFEKKERSPFQAYLAAGLVNELRAALLASTPAQPAQQPVERKPMTREQVRGLMETVGYEAATPQEKADFINGIRHAERHHGIRE